ncbi:MAG: hypothetical protein HYR90_02545 [Candidatus Andersenbacteria bacterium]|nr:hypothetical protein [Candidatus Andersenbacteria bacterium]MBI3251036.1 hypothetical protein [Candidatus Andersenbacteria bacterium]
MSILIDHATDIIEVARVNPAVALAYAPSMEEMMSPEDSDVWQEYDYTEAILTRETNAVLGYINGRFVGCCVFSINLNDPTIGKIQKIAVKNISLYARIAPLLVQETLAYLKMRGCLDIQMDLHQDCNFLQFILRSAGFRFRGKLPREHPLAVNGDAFLFSCEL